MTFAKKLFDPAQLTAAVVTYYTCPVNTKCILKQLTFCNPTTSAAPRTVTVHLVPSGGTASDTNMIISARNLAVGETWDYFCNHVLNAGDFIQALASSATDVSIHGAGLEVVQ